MLWKVIKMPRAYCDASDCEYHDLGECWTDEVFLDEKGKCRSYKKEDDDNNE